MPVSITIDTRKLRDLMKDKRMRRKLEKIVKRASTTAARDMKGHAKKRVRKRKRIKAGDVNKGLVSSKRGRSLDDLEIRLDVRGDPIPLTKYPGTRQTKKGVTAKINTGKRSFIPHAFIATLASGRKSVFTRRGAERLPLDQHTGSTVGDALLHSGEAQGIMVKGAASFNDTVSRLLRTL